MKLSEHQRSRSFFDLDQRSLRFQSYLVTFGLYTQVSDSGPLGPLVFHCVGGEASDYSIKGQGDVLRNFL